MNKFRAGDVVRFADGWCEEGEKHYRYIVLENVLNPCTNEMSRYTIGCLNSSLRLGSVECVEDYMIERC